MLASSMAEAGEKTCRKTLSFRPIRKNHFFEKEIRAVSVSRVHCYHLKSHLETTWEGGVQSTGWGRRDGRG